MYEESGSTAHFLRNRLYTRNIFGHRRYGSENVYVATFLRYYDTNSPPWIDGEVRHIMHKKYRALKRNRENSLEDGKRKLRFLSNEIKKLVRCEHRNYLYTRSRVLLKIKNCFGVIKKLYCIIVQRWSCNWS
jgi:hypothetical protein